MVVSCGEMVKSVKNLCGKVGLDEKILKPKSNLSLFFRNNS